MLDNLMHLFDVFRGTYMISVSSTLHYNDMKEMWNLAKYFTLGTVIDKKWWAQNTIYHSKGMLLTPN